MTRLDENERLARAARERADAATPGPWSPPEPGREVIESSIGAVATMRAVGAPHRGPCSWADFGADAAFIAAARIDVPALAAAVLSFRERAIEAMVLAMDNPQFGARWVACELINGADPKVPCQERGLAVARVLGLAEGP